MDEFFEVLGMVLCRLIWVGGCFFWLDGWIEALHFRNEAGASAMVILGLIWVVGGIYWLCSGGAAKPADEGEAYRAIVENQNAHGNARLATAQEFNALNNARSPFDKFKF